MKEQILELIEQKQLNINDYADYGDLIEDLDYDGSLHMLIDGMVSIYNYELRQWAVDNWTYIEDAMEYGLIDNSEFDYHKAIQAGQYMYYQEEAYTAIEAILTENVNVA